MDAAYELFARRGIRDVGITELIARAGVAKATFYAHFASKDELVLAFLERCHQEWTLEAIISESSRRSENPVGRLLAIFDILDEWFQREDFEACSFMTVMLEMGSGHRLGQASVGYLAQVRSFMQDLAAEAGLADPEGFARSCHILTKGAIVSAVEGDTEAAVRAKRMAVSLVAGHGGGATPPPVVPAGS